MHKINILNVATTDEGGAGIASLYFNEMFIREGYNSVLLVKDSKFRKKNVIALNLINKYSLFIYYAKIRWKLKLYIKKFAWGKIEEKYCYFNPLETLEFISAQKIMEYIQFKPDVIVLHWVSNFVNAELIKQLQKLTEARIFWIAMDNAPLTGGCHYPWDCKGFEQDCSNCPAILNINKKVIANKIFKYKSSNLPKDIELIVCSETDYLRAIKSTIFKTKKVHKILFPLDEMKFKPANKKELKEKFGIPKDTFVVFNGSIKLTDKRKGSEKLHNAILILQEKLLKEYIDISKLLILTAGNNQPQFVDEIKFPVKNFSFLNEMELIRVFQMADVFVSSSLEDSGPLMVNQSMMCGTPVVSFDIGVAKDLVIPGQTGYLAKLGNVEELAEGIKNLLKLNEIENIEMSANCRKLALEKCHPKTQTDRLIKIFNPNY